FEQLVDQGVHRPGCLSCIVCDLPPVPLVRGSHAVPLLTVGLPGVSTRPRGSECRVRLHVVAGATTVARRSRPDPTRARRVLAVAVVAVVAGQLAAGLVLDAAPPSVRFADGARALARAGAVGNAPYVLLLGSSRFWKIDLDTARQTLLETIGGAAPQVVQGAVLGGDAVIADYLLERLLAAGSRPVLIVAETGPETV